MDSKDQHLQPPGCFSDRPAPRVLVDESIIVFPFLCNGPDRLDNSVCDLSSLDFLLISWRWLWRSGTITETIWLLDRPQVDPVGLMGFNKGSEHLTTFQRRVLDQLNSKHVSAQREQGVTVELFTDLFMFLVPRIFHTFRTFSLRWNLPDVVLFVLRRRLNKRDESAARPSHWLDVFRSDVSSDTSWWVKPARASLHLTQSSIKKPANKTFNLLSKQHFTDSNFNLFIYLFTSLRLVVRQFIK